MAKISYDAVSFGQQNSSTSNQKVEWFSLKNDGDSALVRIMEDSLETLEILTVHPINLNGKFVKANCIRDITDSIEKCPLCASGAEVQQRVYLKLLVYSAPGSAPVPKVWERSASFVKVIQSKLESYGPLSDCLFTIKRCGERGNLKTTYNIDYAPPQAYPPESYKKQPELFTNYSAVGAAVFDKSFNDLAYYVEHHEFPSSQTSTAAVSPQIPAYEPVVSAPTPAAPFTPPSNPAPSPSIDPTGQLPWEQPAQVERPKRYY